MKRFFVLMVCVLLMCAMPVVAYADEALVDETEQTTTEGENIPTVDENATEGENSGETVPEETMTDMIVEYVQSHLEEISVIVTLLITIFFEIRKHGKLNGTIGTLNNNAVTVAKNSADAIESALGKVDGIAGNVEGVAGKMEGFAKEAMNDISGKVEGVAEILKSYKDEITVGMAGVASIIEGYKNEIASLLSEIRKSDEEKQALEKKLTECEKYLKTSKLANVEFANELAELLCLANIPPSKKEEFYARHRAALAQIAEAESTEVKVDDGQEA